MILTKTEPDENAGFAYHTNIFMTAVGIRTINFERKISYYAYKLLKIFYKYYFIYSIVSMWCTIPIIWKDTALLNESLTIIITSTMDLIKFLILNVDGIEKLLAYINEQQSFITREGNKSIKKLLKSYSVLNNFFTKIIGYATLSVMIMYVIRGIILVFTWEEVEDDKEYLLTKRPVLFLYKVPFMDMDEHYLVVLILNIITIYCTGNSYIVFELIFITFTIFCLFKLKLLQHFIKNLNVTAKWYAKKKGIDEERAFFILLKEFSKEYNDVLSYMETVVSYVQYPVMLEVMGMAVQIAVIVFQVTLMETFLDYITYGSFASLIFFHLFYLSYIGNKIQLESSEIGRVLFLETNWYNHGKEVNLMLRNLLLRSQKPLKIFIGPFGALSLSTFINLTKASFSYLTFLQNMT